MVNRENREKRKAEVNEKRRKGRKDGMTSGVELDAKTAGFCSAVDFSLCNSRLQHHESSPTTATMCPSFPAITPFRLPLIP